jgi:hypothetical protein
MIGAAHARPLASWRVLREDDLTAVTFQAIEIASIPIGALARLLCKGNQLLARDSLRQADIRFREANGQVSSSLWKSWCLNFWRP